MMEILSPPLISLMTMAGMTLLLVAAGKLLAQKFGAQAVQETRVVLRQNADKESKLVSIMRRLSGNHDDAKQERRRKKLFQAGFSGPSVHYYFSFIKLLSGLTIAIISFTGLTALTIVSNFHADRWLLLCALGFLVGYSLPGAMVETWAKRYVDRIARDLPDALDLMLVCVEAGQSLDQSLIRVARSMKRIHPELAERFEATSEALKAGEDRADAFARLAYVTDNQDLQSFATVVLQASSMGTPMADTFRIYAEEQRERRFSRIEEKANMLPTKMTLGTMVFTVPSLLLLLLTPAIYSIMQSF